MPVSEEEATRLQPYLRPLLALLREGRWGDRRLHRQAAGWATAQDIAAALDLSVEEVHTLHDFAGAPAESALGPPGPWAERAGEWLRARTGRTGAGMGGNAPPPPGA